MNVTKTVKLETGLNLEQLHKTVSEAVYEGKIPRTARVKEIEESFEVNYNEDTGIMGAFFIGHLVLEWDVDE